MSGCNDNKPDLMPSRLSWAPASLKASHREGFQFAGTQEVGFASVSHDWCLPVRRCKDVCVLVVKL